MNIQLKPIKPKPIYEQVFEQIRDLIFRSELKPGDKIPSERELTEQLDVSRVSVRNAISKLVVLGFLENRQGQGTFVCQTNSLDENPLAMALKASDSSIKDLLEVRMGLECNAAALAAERADEEDIKILEGCINKIHERILLGRLGAEADVAFHMAIAFATKNPAQVHIMKNFYDFLMLGIKKSLMRLYEDPSGMQAIRDQHLKIVQAIRNRDPHKSYMAMKAHIQYVISLYDEVGVTP
jgi:GntR family transcriptional repressor for pyruvate dehydrogenase complex